jgi:AraC-like DNA-binding protein
MNCVHYQEIAPDPRLRAYVKCFWTLQGTDPTPAPERVLPDGRCELVLHCGDAFERVDAGGARAQPRDLFVGPSTRAIVIKSGVTIDLVAVRFHPGGAALLLAAPLHELRDLAPGCGELDVRFGLDLFDALHERSAAERVALFQSLLLRRLERSRADTQMLHLQSVIERTRGNIRIEDLARHAGLSLRQLQRRFQVATGVSPKVLCRLVRLQKVLELARNPAATLGRVAAQAGYADQSHLTREFNELAGLTPRQYFSATHQLNELFFSGDS